MFRNVLFKLKQALYKTVIVRKPRYPHSRGSTCSSSKQKSVITQTHMIVFAPFDIGAFRIVNLRLKKNKMDLADQKFKPPVRVQGMVDLDRTKFDDVLKVPAITIPVKNLQRILKQIKSYGLKMKGLSAVVELEKTDPNFKNYKKFLLDPRKIKCVSELPTEVKEIMLREKISLSSFELFDIKLSYDNWNFSEIMQAIMPDNLEGVTGYSEIGHIAHFNLREKALPYKHIIGKVLLDKIPSLKTVVNKLNTIDNTYRTFQMELLAGENNFLTQTKENGCVFELDFSKVYWNSRLGTEHHRMTKDLKCSDIVFDVFAGIGPFAVPSTKRRARVFANDLNPFSYESLKRNISLNGCDSDLITCSNLDGREFIQTVVKDQMTSIYTKGKHFDGILKENITGISILMNLPALAYTFLDSFIGLLSEVESFDSNTVLPIVHCYCFTNQTEAADKWEGNVNSELKHRIMNVIEGLKEDDIHLRVVRDVAPQKVMMCVSFQLKPEILCGRVITRHQSDEPPAKCQKLDFT